MKCRVFCAPEQRGHDGHGIHSRYGGCDFRVCWIGRRRKELTQAAASELLWVNARTFQRWADRYEAGWAMTGWSGGARRGGRRRKSWSGCWGCSGTSTRLQRPNIFHEQLRPGMAMRRATRATENSPCTRLGSCAGHRSGRRTAGLPRWLVPVSGRVSFFQDRRAAWNGPDCDDG